VTAPNPRPGEEEAPGRACRIADIVPPNSLREDDASILFADCGWQTVLEQGVVLQHTVAFRRFSAHTCLPARGAA
jgi:hypothetical protein